MVCRVGTRMFSRSWPATIAMVNLLRWVTRLQIFGRRNCGGVVLPPRFGPPTSVPDTPVVGSKENSFSPNFSLGSGLYIRRKSGTKSPPRKKSRTLLTLIIFQYMSQFFSSLRLILNFRRGTGCSFSSLTCLASLSHLLLVVRYSTHLLYCRLGCHTDLPYRVTGG